MNKRLVLLMGLAVLALGLGGWRFFTHHMASARQQAESELVAINQTKVEQINAWRRERLADAWVLSDSPFLAEAIQSWLAKPNREQTGRLRQHFLSLRARYGYHDVLLVDPAGRVRFSVAGLTGVLDDAARRPLQAALTERRATLSDIHAGALLKSPHLGVIAPIVATRGGAPVPLGAIILIAATRQQLDPLLATWPMPSPSAESLLVRQEGADVLYLSPLRHAPVPALTRRIPLTQTDRPAVQAVLGKTGVFAGRDYRGVDVLSAVSPIAGSSWFLVTKIDTAEILAGPHRTALLLSWVLLGGLATLAAGGLSLWQRRERNQAQILLKAESERHASDAKFRALFDGATDAILLQTPTRFLDCNPRALELFGYADKAALIGLHPADLSPATLPDGRAAWEAADAHIQQALEQGHSRFEWLSRRADGQLFPSEVLLSAYPSEGQTLLQATVRDISERKQAEQALNEHAARLQRISALSSDITYSCTTEQGGTFALDWMMGAVEPVTGYSLEAIMERGCWRFLVVEEDRGLFNQSVAGLTPDTNGTCELRIRHRDGHLVWLASRAECVMSRRNAGIHILYGSLVDITARKQAEQALRFNAARLRFITDHVPIGIAQCDADLRFKFVNKTFGTLFGVDTATVIDKTPREVLGDEIYTRVQPYLDTAHAGHPVEYDLALPAADGTARVLTVSYAPERDADGQVVVGIIAALLDVTERRAADETLRKLSFAVEQSPESIAITDLGPCIEYVNAAFLAATGYTREEVIGQNPRVLNSGKTPKANHDELWAALTQGQSWQGEFINRRKDGSEYIEWASISPIRQPDGRITHYLAIKQDITQRKQAEADLLEAQRAAQQASQAKSEFLANMSHEIRTPMNAILGLAQILERDGLTPDQHEMLHKISESSHSLLRIINDILDISKIEAGQLRVERQPFALSAVLDRVANLLAMTARDRGIALTVRNDASPPGSLMGDPLRIEQVLTNLISNAIKFTEQGSVAVEVKPVMLTDTAARLRFEVRDTGIGVTPEVLKSLFQPFTQADASTTRRFGGTGLGLSISKRLVELMDGAIGAISTPGQGSTFWFELPFDRKRDHQPTPATPTVPAPPQGQHLIGLQVLAVDDNRINLFMLERALQREGAVVQPAGDGQQALDVLKADPRHFDVVLMDIQMPVMDGLTATRAIRADPALADLPVIALTAGALGEERQAAMDAGMTDFITKPLDLGRMVAVLSAVKRGDPQPS